jgi:hypothetical protein
MAEGTNSYMGIAAALNGENTFTAINSDNDVITIQGASGQAGDLLVVQTSTPTEVFIVGSTGAATLGSTLVVSGSSSFGSQIAKMVLSTVALASLASNATASVALTGITTKCVAIPLGIAASTTGAMPVVWVNAADKLGYGAAGTETTAQTVAIWYFATG